MLPSYIIHSLKIFFFAVFALLSSYVSAGEAKLVEIGYAIKQDLILQTNLLGTITSKQEITFAAKFDGILTKIYIESGRKVKAGEIIAEMENEDTKNTYELALQSEKILHDQYERALKLHSQGYINRETLEDKKQKWYQEKQHLIQAKKALENSYLRAPFSGRLGVFKVKQGSYLKAGSEIITLYNPKEMLIDLNIPESLAANIKAGVTAQVLGKEFQISSIQHVINPETRMVDAKIELERFAELRNVIIGNLVEVILTADKVNNTLVVPKSSIYLKQGKNHIFRIRNDKAELVPVELGKQNDRLIEILSGINEEDQIILFGQNSLQNGDLVKVYNK